MNFLYLIQWRTTDIKHNYIFYYIFLLSQKLICFLTPVPDSQKTVTCLIVVTISWNNTHLIIENIFKLQPFRICLNRNVVIIENDFVACPASILISLSFPHTYCYFRSRSVVSFLNLLLKALWSTFCRLLHVYVRSEVFYSSNSAVWYRGCWLWFCSLSSNWLP